MIMAVRIVTLALTAAIIFVVIIAFVVVIVDFMLIDGDASIVAATNACADACIVAPASNNRDRRNLRNENAVGVGVGCN
jgi:hypothetical protein